MDFFKKNKNNKPGKHVKTTNDARNDSSIKISRYSHYTDRQDCHKNEQR